MVATVDKVIVTNLGALRKKYGAKGLDTLKKAIDGLILADRKRGLATVLVPLDDRRAMAALSATRVKKASDPVQNKQAIDEVYRAMKPDYIVLLGSVDVVPHQDVKNPIHDPDGEDPDQFAYGDLPYACESPHSQDIKNFVGPSRVIGRIPDITAGRDPRYLASLLMVAAGYKQVSAQTLQDSFCVTAEIWSRSTAQSITNTFGASRNLQSVPPKNYRWPVTRMNKPIHFFNCHGAPGSSQFYGQPKSGKQVFPPALDAAFINGHIKEGTIAAAECCYGAELYPPSATQKQTGICNVYLENKAYGFFGSTTIAYGPETGNGQADLICQYFLQSVMRGASLGRAALEARQNFVRSSSPVDPSDLKTLAQFNLLGDPSLTPVATPKAYSSITKDTHALAERSERKDRRAVLYRSGHEISASEPVPLRSVKKTPKAIVQQLEASARADGHAPAKSLSFVIRHQSASKAVRTTARTKSASAGYHILFARPVPGPREAGVVDITAFIGKEVSGELVSIWKIRSR
ncbi:hypothetical protein ACQKRQ_38410 [Paraburkholderia sp. NPDC080076]|uniref:hypothetical protein n=1 Tax=Paraburkholderia sp. NPDC080076 TaxID=3390605 RepID=UPI003D085743